MDLNDESLFQSIDNYRVERLAQQMSTSPSSLNVMHHCVATALTPLSTAFFLPLVWLFTRVNRPSCTVCQLASIRKQSSMQVGS